MPEFQNAQDHLNKRCELGVIGNLSEALLRNSAQHLEGLWWDNNVLRVMPRISRSWEGHNSSNSYPNRQLKSLLASIQRINVNGVVA